MVGMTAPQQFSPDGQWWWDGAQWVPASQAPTAQQPPMPEQPAAPEQPAQPATPAQPAYPAPYGQQPYGQAPYGQAPYGGQVPYGAPLPQKSTDGKAIGSFISSFFFFIFGIGSIVAIVLGHLSRSGARKQGREPSGLALAGLILGYLGLAATVAFFTFAITNSDTLVSAFDSQLELQTAADAEHSYHNANGAYTDNLDSLRAFGYLNVRGKADIQVISATTSTFCISATSFGETRYVDQQHSHPTTQPCG
jgi:hypothetical protein